MPCWTTPSNQHSYEFHLKNSSSSKYFIHYLIEPQRLYVLHRQKQWYPLKWIYTSSFPRLHHPSRMRSPSFGKNLWWQMIAVAPLVWPMRNRFAGCVWYSLQLPIKWGLHFYLAAYPAQTYPHHWYRAMAKFDDGMFAWFSVLFANLRIEMIRWSSIQHTNVG